MTAAHHHQLEAFAGRRPGWKLIEVPEEHAHYARRFIVVMDVTYSLLVRHDPDRPAVRDCWKSSYLSAGNRLHEMWAGTFDDVTAEIVRVEKNLDTVNKLRECRSVPAAAELMEPLKGADVRFIADVLAMGTAGSVSDLRARIVRRTCGARLQFDALSDYKRW